MELAAVADVLTRLREDVAAVRLHLDVTGVAGARGERAALLAQLDDYLLPRLREIDAPLLAVVGGSTGAGKSTLVNSLVGAEVSAPGVRRPTTRAPVLVCAPPDRGWFESDRILPGLARRTGGAGGPGELALVADPAVPPGFALLDAPDIDSVVAENRALAAQLLAAADLWLFVTTAARYADAVPWGMLRQARERSTALAVVLDRVPPEAIEVRDHLAEMLAAEGLAGTPVLVVPECDLADGLLPDAALAQVRGWVSGLASDAQARASVVRQTLLGALEGLDRRIGVLLAAAAEQQEAAQALADSAAGSYSAASVEVDEAVRSGTLLRGEVFARWQEYVGTGQLMRGLQAGVARARDRLVAAFSGQPPPDEQVAHAVEGSIEAVVRAAADRAAERAARGWAHDPAGRPLLSGEERLDRPSRGLDDALPRLVRDWQGAVIGLVGEQAAGKRATARLASYSVNGAGLVVMLAAFAHTGGLLGAEVAVAGGTSVVGQRLLEAILGDQAVRSLAEQARADLMTRVTQLLHREAARFAERLAPVRPDPEVARRLASTRDELAAARR